MIVIACIPCICSETPTAMAVVTDLGNTEDNIYLSTSRSAIDIARRDVRTNVLNPILNSISL